MMVLDDVLYKWNLIYPDLTGNYSFLKRKKKERKIKIV